MKKNFLFLLLLPFSIFAQCVVPNSLKIHYGDDVKKMAWNIITNTANHPSQKSIDIPQGLQDEIMLGLAAVYNEKSLNVVDSIFNIYCLHSKVNGFIQNGGLIYLPKNILNLYRCYIKLDTTEAWTKNWLKGNIVTGFTNLDNLLKKYDTKVENSFFNDTKQLVFNQPINVKAMTDSLAKFKGVKYAEPIGMTDGDHISYLTDGTKKTYIFTAGLGDCPSGCTFQTSWTFEVDANCKVKYVSRKPQVQPSEFPIHIKNCKITTSYDDIFDNKKVKIYPNPVENTLFINNENDFEAKAISITDIYGKNILTQYFSNSVELNQLPKGFFIIHFWDKNQKILARQKFIHQ